MNRKQRRITAKQATAGTTQKPIPLVARLFEDALGHHRAGRLTEAEDGYKRILKINTRHADSLHLLGVLAAMKGQTDEGERLIGKAIAINENVPYYHNNIGKIYKDNNRLPEALAHLEKAVRLLPAYVDAHNNLGTVFLASHRYKDAESCFRRALDIQPAYPDAHNNLGSLYYKQGLLERAQASYEQALALNPHSSDTHYNLALLRYMKIPLVAWGPYSLELLAQPWLQPFHRFDILVRLALHGWTIGKPDRAAAYLNESESFPFAKTLSPDKKIFSAQAYRNLLISLLNHYSSNPFLPSGTSSRAAVIGDSHCVTYAHTELCVAGGAAVAEPHLVMGCKAWHLAQKVPNLHRQVFTDTLDRLTTGMRCLMSVGEIDCRHTEGIIAHHKKSGAPLDGIITATVKNYVANVTEEAKARGLDMTFINVPAPYIDALARHDPTLTDETTKTLVHVIRAFNERLSVEASVHGLRVVDIYNETANADGVADGLHHLDGYHPKPYVLGLAARKLS